MIDARDVELRNLTYGLVGRLGRIPSAAEAAVSARVGRDELVATWRRLHDAHALVFDRRTDELLMAHPFSAVPTAYRVRVRGRWWYANCGWDAFGICAALHGDGTIETACPDGGEAIRIEVADERPDGESLLFHCLVPAARWYDDVVFT